MRLALEGLGRSRSVNDPNRDTAALIDVQFGSIKFLQKKAGAIACVTVDVTFPNADPGDGALAMEVEFPADPETETILAIVETGRLKAIERLKSVARQLEAKSAAMLLFGQADAD